MELLLFLELLSLPLYIHYTRPKKEEVILFIEVAIAQKGQRSFLGKQLHTFSP